MHFYPAPANSKHLNSVASYYAHIPRDLPTKCQLPEVVPLPNGRTIHRPPAWA